MLQRSAVFFSSPRSELRRDCWGFEPTKSHRATYTTDYSSNLLQLFCSVSAAAFSHFFLFHVRNYVVFVRVFSLPSFNAQLTLLQLFCSVSAAAFSHFFSFPRSELRRDCWGFEPTKSHRATYTTDYSSNLLQLFCSVSAATFSRFFFFSTFGIT